MLAYYVFKTGPAGQLWLSGDERSWSRDFHDAAEFTSADLAKDIGERECTADTDTLYVFGLLPS